MANVNREYRVNGVATEGTDSKNSPLLLERCSSSFPAPSERRHGFYLLWWASFPPGTSVHVFMYPFGQSQRLLKFFHTRLSLHVLPTPCQFILAAMGVLGSLFSRENGY